MHVLLLIPNKGCHGPVPTGESGMRVRPARTLGQRKKRLATVFTFLALLIFCVPALSQNQPDDLSLPAIQLLRRAIDGELKAQAEDHSHWMYQVKTNDSGKEEVKLVVETRYGDLGRLQSVNGQPLTAQQEKEENERIKGLLQNADEQKKRRHATADDDRQMEHLFRMIPDAVLARYGERKGDLVEILFEPNPGFHPSSHADAVFHEMEGSIWINPKQNRLAEIQGRLMREVKFYGGLLGYLDSGGEFHVKQTEVASGHWEMSFLHVNMHGKVLFFKTISVQQNEIRSNFQRVSDNLTLTEAAEELQKECSAKSAAIRDNQELFAAGARLLGSANSKQTEE